MTKKFRPTFYTKSGKPIRAAGILLYHEELGFLMQEKIKYVKKNEVNVEILELSDFGGKTDAMDKNVLDTMLREFKEETNNKIILQKKNLKNQKFRYYHKSKYLLAIVKTNKTFQEEIKSMGDFEQHDHIARKVLWVDLNNNNKKIHNRLQEFVKKRIIIN